MEEIPKFNNNIVRPSVKMSEVLQCFFGNLAGGCDLAAQFLKAFNDELEAFDAATVIGQWGMQRVSFMAVADLPWRATGIPPGMIDVGGDFAGFGHADAAQSPDDHDDLANQHFFERTDGRKTLM